MKTDLDNAFAQIAEGLNKPIDWLSYGSHAVHGQLKGIVHLSNGLHITLTNGRRVVWRMNHLQCVDLMYRLFVGNIIPNVPVI